MSDFTLVFGDFADTSVTLIPVSEAAKERMGPEVVSGRVPKSQAEECVRQVEAAGFTIEIV